MHLCKLFQLEKQVVSYFVEPFFLASPFFLANFVGQGILKKDIMVWLDGARPLPIKSKYEIGEVVIRPAQYLQKNSCW